MGLFIDACARVLAFTAQRRQPSYAAPTSRAADPLHRETNSDSSITNMRRYVAESTPARTAPLSGDVAGQRPTNSSIVPQRAITDRRPDNAYPRTNEGVTNVHATSAKPMPYGLQPDPSAEPPQRPGASINVLPPGITPKDGAQ